MNKDVIISKIWKTARARPLFRLLGKALAPMLSDFRRRWRLAGCLNTAFVRKTAGH